MIGLNIYFGPRGKEPESFPVFGSEFISDYDKSVNTHRLHVRDAFRSDLRNFVEQCEANGYQILGFHFAVDREEIGFGDAVAAVIGYQRFGFFEGSEDKTWESNEHRRVGIPEGAAIVEAANQYVFVGELAEALREIRGDLEWKPVATIDKYNRDFERLVTRAEHSFLSPATVIGSQWTLLWVAGSAEPPDDLFFDRIAIGPEGVFHPLIASRGVALKLARRFPGFPLTPVLPCSSETGKAVVGICELLKSRISPVDHEVLGVTKS